MNIVIPPFSLVTKVLENFLILFFSLLLSSHISLHILQMTAHKAVHMKHSEQCCKQNHHESRNSSGNTSRELPKLVLPTEKDKYLYHTSNFSYQDICIHSNGFKIDQLLHNCGRQCRNLDPQVRPLL